ncbi:MAG: hypothetical protein ABI858_02205 [Pseudoxanthomonas sp.]
MKAVIRALSLAVFFAFTSTGHAEANKDVIQVKLYRCVGLHNAAVYTNSPADYANCVLLSTILAATHRPGLSGWRPFYLDSNLALLIYDQRTRPTSAGVEAWVMYGYTKLQEAKGSSRPYDRMVIKVIANCDQHDLKITTAQLWNMRGEKPKAAGMLFGYFEEVAPSTIDDLVVAEICKPPEPAAKPAGAASASATGK